MTDSKALAYELTKIVPLEVLEQYKKHPNHSNDLERVGRVLRKSHLPGWLTYAIENSDHEVTDIDTKIPAYISEDTIISVAEEYASKPDTGIINLNQPGERDWMREDPLQPYREQFKEEYQGAVTALSTVFEEVFSDEFDAFQDECFRRVLAEEIIDELDMFTWELYRDETTVEDADTRVAEWFVDAVYLDELAEAYMELSDRELPDESKAQFQLFQSLRDDFRSVREDADLASYDGRFDTHNVVPRDMERVNARMEELREDTAL